MVALTWATHMARANSDEEGAKLRASVSGECLCAALDRLDKVRNRGLPSASTDEKGKGKVSVTATVEDEDEPLEDAMDDDNNDDLFESHA